MKVYIELMNDTIIPKYEHVGDAGMDVRATEDIIIKPQETKIIKTGFKIATPTNIETQVRPRSGLSYKTPLRISNSPGTVDSSFRDEVGIIITNTSMPFYLENGFIKENDKEYYLDEKNNSHGTYIIKKGDRIAQIVFVKYENVEFEKVNNILDIGENRNGGFGSSGIK